MRPDGFRPLSLVPPLPNDSDRGPGAAGDVGAVDLTGSGPTDPSATDSRAAHPATANGGRADDDRSVHDAIDTNVTPAQADARAQEIVDWLAERERRLAGDRSDGRGRRDPSERWRSVGPLPVPDRRLSGVRRPGEPEMSAALQEAMRRSQQIYQDALAERWGGMAVLEALDAEPLPDEPFDWSTVPTAHRGAVEQVLALVDDVCDQWFDLEHRTACRRLLARVAGEPWVIARRGKLATIAGAIVWTIASFNGTIGRRRRGYRIVPASDIAWHLGLSSGSAFAKRSIDIRIAAGIHLHREGPQPVGEPGLITSHRRHHAIRLRETYRDALE